MEQEFDKEIDALLRKLQPPGFLPDAGSAIAHLEADELAAFAENALPEAARQTLTLHLADCGRCRKILSETILMNSDAAPIAVAAAAAPAVETVAAEGPWYRRLFIFPNLAYVMGGLVLVFSGFLGYVVLRNTSSGEATVSQITTDTLPAASGPNAGQDQEYSPGEGSTANAAANAASTSANATVNTASRFNTNTATASNTAPEGYADLKREDKAAAPMAAPPPAAVTDSVLAGQPAPRAAKSGAGQDERAKAAAELNKEKDDSRLVLDGAGANVAQEREETKLRAMPGAISGGPSKKAAPAGPSRDLQTQFPNRSQNAIIEAYPMKNAGGKKFELRGGVWYDTAYRGQSTINVRRGTESFLRLDGGLRSIAESVGGTSVIVWSGKAYRIQ